MSCLLMSYNMNCTDCNVSRLSSTTMGKMMLGHNGVRGSRDYDEGVAETESKHRKTYPLRKRMHAQPGNFSSQGVAKELHGTVVHEMSTTQDIVEQWNYQGSQDRLRGEAPQAERSEDTGKENSKIAAVMPRVAESRPRRLASLNAEAVNNLLLEREDGPTSNRRCRKGPSCGMEYAENRPEGRTGHPAKKRIGSSCGSLDGDVFTCTESEPAPGRSGWESGLAELPAKKRMASLNAAAFLKLSNTKDVSTGRRSRVDGESKAGKANGGTRPSCPHPLAGRRCPRAKRRDSRSDIATKLNPGTGDVKGHSEELASAGQHARTLPINTDLPCPYTDETNGYFHRLSMLVGSQAMIQPKYQALEESSVSGAEFTQPMAPFQSHSTLTLLDNFVSGPDHYEFLPPEVCLASPVDDLYLHYDRSDLLPIDCNSPHGCHMCPAAFTCCTPPDDEGSLLISQSAGEVELLIRKCYPAVERDGEVIKVRDTVLLKSGPRKKSIPYVAKVSALWEDPTSGELMMSLYWYYRPEHIQGGRNPSIHCENEIFASRHQDENSVACIEEKCYVLTFSEYCRFCALAKWREEGAPDHRPVVPPSEEYSTPPHRKVPENTDPDLVFICRHVYDFRHGRTLKNPQ
ncbi:hypothetical protein scyTo_0012685 [Scyliorhinus torazame]|uniref:BAH domain-containing protein n=2 Tax=Scyliorhinus torazame TaxID=75743 RepID=A0A401NGT4_SCYTO|nr:hypothetical protein [Scyliorhinus torazame]